MPTCTPVYMHDVHTIHAYACVLHAHSFTQTCVHVLIPILSHTRTYSSMPYAYHKHTPHSSREKPSSTPLLRTKGVLFAFFKRISRLRVAFYAALYVAVHEASRESHGEGLQGLQTSKHTHAPVTLGHWAVPDSLHAPIPGSGGSRDTHLHPLPCTGML